MVGGIYQDEFFMHVLGRSILKKTKRILTSIQFVIMALIFKLLVSKVSITIQNMPL